VSEERQICSCSSFYGECMKVGIVGVGHVGLVTAAGLASIGHEVTAMDLEAAKIEQLRSGKAPFFEPELDDLLAEQTASGRLRFTTALAEAVGDADVVFICVGRPSTPTSDPSLTAVEAVGREIAQHASSGAVIVEKSTVPPGTADRLRLTIARERPGLDFSVVSNPEFLREGQAVRDSLEPARVVVGSDDERGFRAMREMYRPLLDGGVQLIETNVRTAELAKLTANAFLSTKISFANAIARVAEATGADVVRVMDVIGSDPRIGRQFLDAGLGYGGYCLSKDIRTLERTSDRAGYDFALLREVVRVNEDSVKHVAAKVEEALWNLGGKRIALLGLAFKPGTDDVRSSPAVVLARRLLGEGAEVVGHDPMASVEARSEVPELLVAADPYEAATGAHCVVICTDWPEYERLDLPRLREVMAYPIIVDGRNALDAKAAEEANFTYLPVGRPGLPPAAGGDRRRGR
jgi:UDPglucose 6-dehydrogenase